MFPAHQRFGAQKITRLEVNLRLIVQDQLIAVYGLAQLLLQLKPFGNLSLHTAFIETKIIALFFGSEHCRIGVLDQRTDILTIIGKNGNTYTGGNKHFLLHKDKWPCNRAADFLGH